MFTNLFLFFNLCRDDWIRTSDPQHPMLIRYRTALRPELEELYPITGNYGLIIEGLQK